jgi:hypothetical protein
LERDARTDKFTQEVAHRFADYTVYDQSYEKIGNVDDLFVDENDSPEYIGVKMGFLETRTTLIPLRMARVNDVRQVIEVAAEKETLKNGPTFDEDREITPQFEKRGLLLLRLPASFHHRAERHLRSPLCRAEHPDNGPH